MASKIVLDLFGGSGLWGRPYELAGDVLDWRITMNNATCRGCGASIVWIKTKSGKSMPCDAEPVHYVPGGKDRAVTTSGNVVSCEIVSGGGEIGYRPHWATCPNAKRFKSGR